MNDEKKFCELFDAFLKLNEYEQGNVTARIFGALAVLLWYGEYSEKQQKEIYNIFEQAINHQE